MRDLRLLALGLLLALLALPAIAQAGCRDHVLCQPGTTAATACKNASAEEIVVRNVQGGRHEITVIPSTTGLPCVVDIMKGYGGYHATNAKLVGQVTCAPSAISLPFEGPADSVWAVVSTAPGGSDSIEVRLRDCSGSD